mmetsp:Transcript_10484/g.18514  ORF Transcript_10484/g.18514 Transcript_10484/m.18514 type:complete len:328 (+) Transcript_10484:34-1017(+)
MSGRSGYSSTSKSMLAPSMVGPASNPRGSMSSSVAFTELGAAPKKEAEYIDVGPSVSGFWNFGGVQSLRRMAPSVFTSVKSDPKKSQPRSYASAPSHPPAREVYIPKARVYNPSASNTMQSGSESSQISGNPRFGSGANDKPETKRLSFGKKLGMAFGVIALAGVGAFVGTLFGGDDADEFSNEVTLRFQDVTASLELEEVATTQAVLDQYTFSQTTSEWDVRFDRNVASISMDVSANFNGDVIPWCNVEASRKDGDRFEVNMATIPPQVVSGTVPKQEDLDFFGDKLAEGLACSQEIDFEVSLQVTYFVDGKSVTESLSSPLPCFP